MIAVVGRSGMGKSTSLRNLDPNTTLIINWERKELPFKGSSKLPQVRPKNIKEGLDIMDKYLTNDKVVTLVHDSFSAFTDMLLEQAKALHSGYDVWSYYNQKIYEFFKKNKGYTDSKDRCVVILAHDESLTDEGGLILRRMKVKGKEWEGVTEKEFDVVLWADCEIEPNKPPEFFFKTITDGKVSAKSPMDMLESHEPNDMLQILQKIKKYDD